MSVEEVPILEKVAFRQRMALQLNQVGFLVLTNKRFIFQPKLVFRRSPLTWTGFFFLWLSVFPLAIGLYYFGGSFPYAETLFVGFLFIVAGASMMGIAFHNRVSKEVVSEFKDIVEIEPAPGSSKILWIKLKNGKAETYDIPERNDLLEELKCMSQGGQAAVPSSLLEPEEINVPKYSIPSKYPGVALRLQKDYVTPKICCACGESASEKIVTAQSTSRVRSQGFIHSTAPAVLAIPRTPFTHPFPICDNCFKMRRRTKFAGWLGGTLGLVAGIALFVSLLFSTYFLSLTDFMAKLLNYYGALNLGGVLGFLFLLLLTVVLFSGLGWKIAQTLGVSLALQNAPKEKRAFFNAIAEDKAIRVLRRPGFVAFGFLSKDFATAFQQINGGLATAVSATEQGNGKRSLIQNSVEV
jgi:hypothetical protein